MSDRVRSGSCIALVFLIAAGSARAQSISTFAGGGRDDGQPATSVFLYGPQGLAFDAAGNLHFAEGSTGQVRRVEVKTGTVSAIVGNGASGFSGDGGLAVNATLNEPRGIAFDAAGNLYIADNDNNRIRKIDAATGIISTFAGGGGSAGNIGDGGAATAAFVSGPWGVAVYRGALYVTEAGFEGNRVRRIDLVTGVIETVAGSAAGAAGFEGDGGPAREAKFDGPLGIAFDAAGNIFVADIGNHRVRRIDAATGAMSTYAGGGNPPDQVGDGLPAAQARIENPLALAFDKDGNLLLTDGGWVRKVDRQTTVITTLLRGLYIAAGLAVDSTGAIYVSNNDGSTIEKLTGSGDSTVVAGGGSFVGDGRTATGAILHQPRGIALDAAGNLYIADSANNLLRRVSAVDRTISTVAGVIGRFYADDQEGRQATTAAIGGVMDVAIDSAGNLYTADPHNDRVWRIDREGKITTYSSGLKPRALAFDSADNLFIADDDADRIRRIDSRTREVTTYAGNGVEGFSGDGGAATAASLENPTGVAVDASGNLYIAVVGRIRRVDPAGTITTIAGSGDSGSGIGEGGPALGASIFPRHIAVHRPSGDLYFTDNNSHRVRKIDIGTGTLSTVAGSTTIYFQGDYSGDNGPATDAKLNFGFDVPGIEVDDARNVFVADTLNNRVRVVYACGTVSTPQLASPADGANVATAPLLTWSAAAGAFRYDVVLDTVSPPQKIVANDVSETTFATSNLQPSTRYFWRAVAKGDPFCPASTASSTVRSFTTAAGCSVGPFGLLTPADGASVVGESLTLTWSPALGASSYDLYLGSTNPPVLFRAGITSTTFTTQVSAGTQYWFVVAHAACDETKTASTPIRSFTLPGPAPCVGAAINLIAPPNGAGAVDLSPELSWSTQGCAVAPFEIFLGTSANPPLLDAGASVTRRTVTGLAPATTYFWRIAGRDSLNPALRPTSAVSSFTTRSCTPPGPLSIIFAPGSVAAGSTYTIVWSAAAGLDGEGGYLVERATNASFTTGVTAQVASTTASSFVAETTGTYFHRVRAVSACDPTRPGPISDTRAVASTDARPNVIFTRQPSAVITALGDRLEDQRTTFAVENIGTRRLSVFLGRQELSGSPPFFTIFDPQGSDSGAVTLDPGIPRVLEVRFSGPPANVARSYQGVIFAAALGEGLGVTPYAFVNLKVGGSPSPPPDVLSGGTAISYVAFPPFAGDDAARPPIAITIRNPGTTPMDLGAEIGPEVWLVPESGWNDPLAAGASRTVNLFSRRGRAPNGSPLPRYTYFTLRTKDGASTRILVQDNDAADLRGGRFIRLDAGSRSFILPEVVSRVAGAATLAAAIRLSNVGGESVQAEVIFTPAGADGFDAAVRRADVVVPANDVVTLTDPLVQLFGLARPATGQIEIRLPRERQGLVNVTASTVNLGRGTAYVLPVVNRGDGARIGLTHTLPGLRADAATTSAVSFVESSGLDDVSLRATLFDASGTEIGSITRQLRRYGYERIENVASAFGRTTLDNARLEIGVTTGGGAVVALGFVGAVDRGATVVSSPTSAVSTAATLAQALLRGVAPSANVSATTVVPVLGTTSAGTNTRTTLGLAAPIGSPATFTAIFREAAGNLPPVTRSIPVSSGAVVVFRDVLAELFAATRPGTAGTILVEGPTAGKVYAILETVGSSGQASPPNTFLPLPTTLSDAVTSAASLAQRPLFYDGLEQSIDSSRGSRWMLVLNEVSGASGAVVVRLYEAGNRNRPIAERDVSIAANEQVKLDTVFSLMGLDAPDRRKDRTNVAVVVFARAGGARVAATAVSTDNITGEVKALPLMPTVGSGSVSVSLVSPVLPAPEKPKKRRAVGR